MWKGDSICTGVRAACHDEIAAYHITAAEDPKQVTIRGCKIVNGEEQEMGTMLYDVDFEHQTLRCDYNSGRVHTIWFFHWNGESMTGTATLQPENVVGRNITLHRTSK